MYGPDDLPFEQINTSTGTVTYPHHDQQGSTRLLTGSTGTKEASFTYDAYGNTTGTTGTAKTPLGYYGQYTSTDTGLIYLRARLRSRHRTVPHGRSGRVAHGSTLQLRVRAESR
jgi:hypothetical protein